MEQIKNLYVGLDLGNENSQMCCFHPRTGELETIGGRTGDNYHFIPTLLGVTENKREWFYGEDVKRIAEHEDIFLVENMIKRISEGEEFIVLGNKTDGAFLLEKFFRKTLVALRTYYSNDSIAKLVVTVEEDNQKLKDTIYQALSNMGIETDRAVVIPYTMSYIYYALNQKRELWQKNIALFDFSVRGLFVHAIYLNRRTQPFAVEIKSKNLSGSLSYEQYEKMDRNHLSKRFLELAKQVVTGDGFSTLYFSGEGFLSNWSDNALQELCAGKRGFRGPNIYVRGAAIYAKDLEKQEFAKRFLILSDDVLKSSVNMRVYKDGKVVDLEVLPAGIPWKEANSIHTIILDREEEITLIVKKVMDGTQSIRMLALEGMPKCPNKMGRFELTFGYENEKTCLITIKDKGFGELSPSTNRIWEKRLEI